MRVSYCLQSDQRNVGVAGRDPFIGENLRFYTIDSPASAKNLGVNRVSWRRHQLGTSDRHRSAGITVPCKLGTCAHRNSSDSSMLAQSRPIWVPLHCSCVAGICFPSWLWQEMETKLKTDAMLITKKNKSFEATSNFDLVLPKTSVHWFCILQSYKPMCN